MHFWIDKRSQQCGFGRSRVAASLSGAGASAGLSFGHPPRRMGGSKSTTSTNNAVANVHRQQQQQHAQQHSHPNYHQQQQSASSSTITTTADCHSAGRNYYHSGGSSHNSNNNNLNGSNSNNSVGISYQQQQLQQQQHNQQQQAPSFNLNNNPHQQQQQQQQHNQSNTHNLNINSVSNRTTNTLNNNLAATAAASSNNILSTTATTTTSISGRSARHNHRTTNSSNIQQLPAMLSSSNTQTGGNSSTSSSGNTLQQHQHYDMRSYHHPQFGNMAVRHYQHVAGENCAIPPYAVGIAQQHYEQQPPPQSQQQQQPQPQQAVHQVIYGPTQCMEEALLDISNSPLQQQQHHQLLQQQQSRQSLLSNTSTHRVLHQSAGSVRASSSNMLESSGTSGEWQLFPSSFKCGMCASLGLTSVFVAGAKFYFDHQGAGLEALILCAFSATFFLAACTVWLCRMPKGLMPTTARAGAMLDEHGRPTCVGGGGVGSGAVATTLFVAPHPDQRMHDQRALAATHAGPPPYHIAILLPESRKEVLPLDESPPPSYDKILV